MKLKRLSDATHQRLLGWTPEAPTARAKRQMLANWEKFGLLEVEDRSEQVELELPDWLKTYKEVAEDAVKQYGKKYLNRLNKFSKMALPELPEVKPPQVRGWQMYDSRGGWQMQRSLVTSDTAMVLDFETVEVKGHWYPVCCVVLTDDTWYVWQADLEDLQPTIDFASNQVIIGHNVPYDRSYLAPEYLMQDSGNRFFDTMAAWIATRGFCNQQRAVYKMSESEANDMLNPGWVSETATNGLDAVYEHYTGQELDKGVRKALVDQGLPFVRQHLADVVWYCLKDVLATFEVFSYVYPEWRLAQPSEASQTAQLLLGNTWLPLSSDRFPKYYATAEAKYQEVMEVAQARLNTIALEVLQNPDELQTQNLDWTEAKTGKNKGLPQWFRGCKGQPSITGRLAPILLGCTWRGQPVTWQETGEVDKKGKPKGAWATVDGFVPHPEEQGKPATDLFVKGMATAVEQGVLDAPGGLKDLLQGIMSGINWKSLRDRVASLKVEQPEGYPVCLPRITVTGTVTRRCADNVWQVASNPKAKRIGTELKSMIEAPPGYTVVGADVDSQEAWIAGCYGDAELGYCGSSPLGLVVLVGQKSDKTDIHSMAASAAGVDRDTAKAVLTYGSLYGQGLKGATDGLKKNLPLETTASCKAKAENFLSGFKGIREYNTRLWVNGLASQAFNYMEKLANSPHPRTTVLGAAMSKALSGQRDFVTTRTNWTIQSAGVDFRDLLVLFTRYCFDKLGVRGRLLLTIHDEIRTMVKTEDVRLATYALQLAHLLVRAYFVDSLGLDCIPTSVAWFSLVDVDSVVRKEPIQPCTTPSQPEPIPNGYSLKPSDLTEFMVRELVAA